MLQQQPRLEREINIQTTSFNISENPNLCSCKQFRLGGDTITRRPHWMQVISGIKAAKPARQRRQLIEDDGELSRWVEFYRKSCVSLAVVSQMLVIMLVVYYICWGSWLSSKLLLVTFQIKINLFYKYFHTGRHLSMTGSIWLSQTMCELRFFIFAKKKSKMQFLFEMWLNLLSGGLEILGSPSLRHFTGWGLASSAGRKIIDKVISDSVLSLNICPQCMPP